MAFTAEGRAAREQVEVVTDQLCRPIIEALGDDFDELVASLGPWGETRQDAGGYPASGPHELASMTSEREEGREHDGTDRREHAPPPATMTGASVPFATMRSRRVRPSERRVA